VDRGLLGSEAPLGGAEGVLLEQLAPGLGLGDLLLEREIAANRPALRAGQGPLAQRDELAVFGIALLAHRAQLDLARRAQRLGLCGAARLGAHRFLRQAVRFALRVYALLAQAKPLGFEPGAVALQHLDLVLR